MSKTSYRPRVKLDFPDYINLFLRFYETSKPDINQHSDIREFHARDFLRTISDLKTELLIKPNTVSHNGVLEYLNEFSETEFAELRDRIGDQLVGDHEFFAIKNIRNGQYLHVDHKVKKVLGISPDDFMHSLNARENWLDARCLGDDIIHIKRYKSIAHHIFRSQFEIKKSFNGQQYMRFRINTQDSHLSYMRNTGYAVIEIRRLFSSSHSKSGIAVSSIVLDRISITADQETDVVLHQFISDAEQTVCMNSYSFLVNAMLLDIPIKYLIFLEERTIHDRYKTLATSVNNQVQKYTGKPDMFDEKYIGDCFLKTIKVNVAKAYNTWSNLSGDSCINISSDLEAVYHARKLGLIPIPGKIRDLVYRNLSFSE